MANLDVQGAAQKQAIARTCFSRKRWGGGMLPPVQGWRSHWRRRVQKV